jgi:hypothetical protein
MEMPYKNKYDGDLERTHKRKWWVGRNIMEGTDIALTSEPYSGRVGLLRVGDWMSHKISSSGVFRNSFRLI